MTACGRDLIKVMDILIELLRWHTTVSPNQLLNVVIYSRASSKRGELKDMWQMSIFNGIQPARTMVPTNRGVKKEYLQWSNDR